MEYGKFMLRTLSENKKVICIDQSWLNDTQFVRRRWRKRGQVNTVSEHQVNPRASLLMAISTDGELYAALTQVNTDSKVFCLFMSQLAKRLSKEDPDWRTSTLALMDGAKYQSCPATEAHLKALGFTVCISAPYSYTTAPIELAFGFIKSVDLNPRRQKVSKSKSPPTI